MTNIYGIEFHVALFADAKKWNTQKVSNISVASQRWWWLYISRAPGSHGKWPGAQTKRSRTFERLTCWIENHYRNAIHFEWFEKKWTQFLYLSFWCVKTKPIGSANVLLWNRNNFNIYTERNECIGGKIKCGNILCRFTHSILKWIKTLEFKLTNYLTH